MFSNTANGAKASAVLYSLIETALCRMRHKAVYAEKETMPNGYRNCFVQRYLHLTGSA